MYTKYNYIYMSTIEILLKLFYTHMNLNKNNKVCISTRIIVSIF